MKKGKERLCAWCGVVKYVQPCHLKHLRSFCSREHANEYQKSKAFYYQCVICGIKVRVQPCQVVLRKRKTCSRICLSLLSRQIAEERRERHGYTKHQLDRLARYSPEAKKWKKHVFSRDNWTCQACGVRGGKLEADHVMPWAFFPDLRFDIVNGRTMCCGCHAKTKTSYKAMREMWLI